MVKGTITGILSVIKIRKVLNKMSELNNATVCIALESEKKSQSQPKVPIEYQQGFTEESATDALLSRKQAVTYLFLDSQGKVEKMETALLNGTVAKITLEEKALIENDINDGHNETLPEVAETSL